MFFSLVSCQQADRLAAALLSLGLKKGDRVGMWAPNCKEWVITQYATARAVHGYNNHNNNTTADVYELLWLADTANVIEKLKDSHFMKANHI